MAALGGANPKAAAQLATMKDMSGEIAASFQPKDVEKGWFEWWEKCGLFRPRSDPESGLPPIPADTEVPSFVILIPPPNVTGNLHIGHALTVSVEDALIRWHRMHGHNTLYIPGTDHAGIATQVQVEKKLAREGVDRHALGRDKFLAEVWKWRDAYGGNILSQFTRLASSADTSRTFFTMDEPRAVAVTEAFVRLADAGLVTRDRRLVHWSCALNSAISDVEVEHQEVTKGSMLRVPGYEKAVEFGYLLHFAYRLAPAPPGAPESPLEEIVVATTRPETILGDTAVAVHPEDPRYAPLIGRHVICPFRAGATIPVVGDATLVNMEFGTGALKVTPAHDANDYECALRQTPHLPMLSIFTPAGKVAADATVCDPEWHNRPRYEVRELIYNALAKAGLLRGADSSKPPAEIAGDVAALRKAAFGKAPHTFVVGKCQRTGDIVEPFLVPQWYVNCSGMAKRALDEVESGRLQLVPTVPHVAVWRHWLENIKPWCVSRQLWWGHRIPAFLISAPPAAAITDEWVVARNEAEAAERWRRKHPGVEGELTIVQDPDVLDTWFSSGLLPFTACGWPNEGHSDFAKFFPGHLLETGHDILFFWVARMVMLSLQLCDKLPFDTVYLHAMVRDAEGRKMSKSLGNVIDPVHVIDGASLEVLAAALTATNLPQKELDKALPMQAKMFPKGIEACGSDALRICLLAYTMSGKNVNLSVDRIVAYRAFGNKLWNACRFAIGHALGTGYVPPSGVAAGLEMREVATFPLAARWIVSRLHTAVEAANAAFGGYEFATLVSVVHAWWLYEFCDVYIEACKPIVRAADAEGASAEAVAAGAACRKVLWVCLDTGLRMAHPLMPFVTEELWHRLPGWAGVYAATSPSIMAAPYPTSNPALVSAADEADMAAVNAVIHAVRSVKASYQLTKERPAVTVCCADARTADVIVGEGPVIATIGGCAAPTKVATEADKPAGSASVVAAAGVTVFVTLAGMIDVPRELLRLKKKAAAAGRTLAEIEKRTKVADYETKVPEHIRKDNAQKAEEATAELQTLNASIAELSAIAPDAVAAADAQLAAEEKAEAAKEAAKAAAKAAAAAAKAEAAAAAGKEGKPAKEKETKAKKPSPKK